MKPVIGSLMLLLVFLMVIHSFWKWSRQFPPAHERESSGVEGGLIVLVGFMAAAVLFNATGFGLMVSAVMGAVPEGFWIRTGLPGILSFAGIVWAMLRLLSGRTPSVRLEASRVPGLRPRRRGLDAAGGHRRRLPPRRLRRPYGGRRPVSLSVSSFEAHLRVRVNTRGFSGVRAWGFLQASSR